jgi:hypothetical protein
VGSAATKTEIAGLGLDPEALLFAPEESAADFAEATWAGVVGYSGEFASTGTEVGIGDDLLVQFESYSTVEYLALVCPTAVSIVDDVDLGVLRDDIERTRSTGELPEHLTGPLITFTGLAEILGWAPGDGPTLLSETLRAELAGEGGALVRRYVAALRLAQLARMRVESPLTLVGFGVTAPDPDRGETNIDAPFVLASADGRRFVGDARRGLFGAVPDPVAAIFGAVSRGEHPDEETLRAVGISQWNADTAAGLYAKLGLAAPTVFDRAGEATRVDA